MLKLTESQIRALLVLVIQRQTLLANSTIESARKEQTVRELAELFVALSHAAAKKEP